MLRLPFVSLVLLVGATWAYGPLKGKEIQWTGGNRISLPLFASRSLKQSGNFSNNNVLATRAVVYKNDVILAFPRYRSGVPITLAKMSLKGITHSQTPFPNLAMQEVGNCNAFQNVVDIFLDPYDVLWVLDAGTVNSIEELSSNCMPKVVAINAKTGKLSWKVDLSPLTTFNSELQYVVVDYSPKGEPFVYVSDAANRAILVLDIYSQRGYPFALPKAVSLGCQQLDWLYMNLIRTPGPDNQLLVTYLCGKHLLLVSSRDLQKNLDVPRVTDLGPKVEDIVVLGTDNASAVFFRKRDQTDVYRWDLVISIEYTTLAHKSSSGLLPVQVVPDSKRGQVRLLESNFQDYFIGPVGSGVNHSLKLI